MDAQSLKDILKDNPKQIKQVLESVGCHSFKEYSTEIRCALPNKHNPTSISVKKDTLKSKIYLPNENVVFGDIFTIIMNIDNCKFPNALKKCHDVLGYEFEYIFKKEDENEHPLAIFRKIKKKRHGLNEIRKYPEEILDQYLPYPHIKFVNDKISPATQTKYGIHYSETHQRILIPHYHHQTGEIVGIFGRTVIDNFEELNIPKYYGVIPYPKTKNLYGLYHNYKGIQEKNYVVVLESEKSVMQLDSMGYEFGVAVGCHDVSPEQRSILIGLDVEVVIAFDKGISREHIGKTCEQFYKKRNVSYMIDEDGLLNNKDSPTNHGKIVFDLLFNERKVYERNNFYG